MDGLRNLNAKHGCTERAPDHPCEIALVSYMSPRGHKVLPRISRIHG